MNKVLNTFLLFLYCLGAFCLPSGDFSILQDLPEMYRHCQSTEDRDMTPIDFITDHLINIDSLFDGHDHGDRQKPHQPIQNHHPAQTSISYICCFTFSCTTYTPLQIKRPCSSHDMVPASCISEIFRPPIYS